jgi:hypothetical protein
MKHKGFKKQKNIKTFIQKYSSYFDGYEFPFVY